MYQTSKDTNWIDEKGTAIPYNRTTKSERLQERKSNQLLKRAMGISSKLEEFKQEVKEVCANVYDVFMEEKNNSGANKKGNFTWFNFDRSIKIEVSINERIEFDDLTITACKDKLNEFLSNNIDAKQEFIKDLVLDAFETTKGKLDTKKVMGLLKYKSKIKDKLFQEAMDLLSDSIRRPESKTYFRIWERNSEGKYENVELNFSSI